MSKATHQAPEHVRSAVVALVRTLGVEGARKKLGISRDMVARIAGGIPVRAGSAALAETRVREALAIDCAPTGSD